MSKPRTFDREKCQRRNRLAATRDGVNAAPVRLLQSAPVDAERVERTEGRLPENEAEALSLINALLPEGAEPLTGEDVYLHYAEAANDNFIPDRCMFMDATTLRNIARNGAEGVAFMNSHRTGGMSHPSELPFGKTFAGRYEEYRDEQGALRRRAVVGIYMLRGQRPNGDQGPSTDDLHAQILGGTVADVSVGIWPGLDVCDVCGNELSAVDREGRWLCPHVPGTHRRMTEEQIRAQEARGVTRGFASYTLVDYRMGEVSAVYDGAVPGAGFRKALSLRRELDATELEACGRAYVALAREGDFRPREKAGIDDFEGADPLTGLTFSEHSQAVLAAVEEWVTRLEGYAALRAREGRPLSQERRAEGEQVRGLTSRLDAVLSAPPAADPGALHRLRVQALRLRVGDLALPSN